ncbi:MULTISPECIES: XRE family transcriptional regulator [Aeromonas]|uniref:XRE family transcriptional regulator n=1 Tax=Aeromonas TaxID=642 RepID=UPI00244B71E7|nr:XRE family transcriptional regulator [Aeromonas caviae]MDH0316067.1 XRE family transcriptional regulator [Aeromonas caviae]MDX7596189.1 XRE family transcriptional regulator [Aeromonas caviae]MDX7612143.1 XRE family transcriptional regulator [Aeromonas caviae]
MFGERLLRARSAAGLSMQALAAQAGISANMIKKYEHGESMPSSGVLVKMSRALGVRSEYFFRPVQVELAGIEYRKRSSTPVSVLNSIKADVVDQAERWQELVNLWPVFPIAKYSAPVLPTQKISKIGDIDSFAEELRAAWSLGTSPISKLIDVLESHGILVIVTNIDERTKFDGLQASIAGQPVIVVSANWPGDRQRFTLAHELGHLLLHTMLPADIDEEKACNRFAGALLLPAAAMRAELGSVRQRLEVQELYMLKMEYGLSMQACLYRACDLAIISESTRKGLFMYFSRNGWRSREPGQPFPKETTLLFQQLVYRALGENIIGESKAAELLGSSLVSFHQARKMEALDATSN